MWRTGRYGLDRGAAAVEFALVLPLFMLLLFGIVDFSRAFNVQLTLSDAAAVGVRTLATGKSVAAAQSDVNSLVPTQVVSYTETTACPPITPGSDRASMTVATDYAFITPVGFFMTFFNESPVGVLTITGTAARQCAS